jgi:YD repeat-containing protein
MRFGGEFGGFPEGIPEEVIRDSVDLIETRMEKETRFSPEILRLKGNVIKKETWLKGKLIETSSFKYDQLKQRAKEIRRDLHGNLREEVYWFYDQKGNLCKEIRKDQDGRVRQTTLFDPDKKVKSVAMQDERGVVWQTNQFQYDKEGLLIKWAAVDKRKNPQGQDVVSEEYQYDSSGRLVSKVRKDSQGKPATINQFEHTKNDQSKRVETDAQGNIHDQSESQFDQKGNKVNEIKKDHKGEVYASNLFEYGFEGQRMRWVWKGKKGQILGSEEYRYDEQGNQTAWVWKDGQGKVTLDYEYRLTYD